MSIEIRPPRTCKIMGRIPADVDELVRKIAAEKHASINEVLNAALLLLIKEYLDPEPRHTRNIGA